MPTLRELQLERLPLEEPLVYPGQTPPWSFLLIDERVARLREREERRVGHHDVDTLGDAVLARRLRGDSVPLDCALLALNAAPTDARTPVVAVGSNAAPAQLRHKLRTNGVPAIVPCLHATIAGLGVGHSAHVSRAGYIAAAPYLDPKGSVELFVLWLDREQREIIDTTEPNYRRTRLPDTCSVKLRSGEHLAAADLYGSRRGVLHLGDRTPLPLGGQAEVIEAIRERLDVPGTLSRSSDDAFVAACRDSDSLRDLVRTRFAELDLTMEDGLPESFAPCPVYGEQPTGLPRPDSYALLIRKSTDDLARQGQACIAVAADAAPLLGDNAIATPTSASSPSALVRVLAREQVPAGAADTDQVVRNATGSAIGEYITLRPAQVTRTPTADVLLGQRRYLTCRVQTADLTVVEQPVCLLDRLTLEMLGVTSGDEIVVEGIPTEPEQRVPSLRIRAFENSEDIVDRRISLHGGGFDARFPSARDALGVDPDLPWAFLDSSARTTLGLTGQKLGTVRIRASRRQQLAKEFREILLLLVLAFVGVIAVVDRPAAQLLTSMALFTLVTTVIAIRLRSRLTADHKPGG